MSKKNKKKIITAAGNTAVEQDAELIVAESETTEVVEVKQSKNDAKVSKDADKKVKKGKKEKKPSRFVRRMKETGSELKKVTWPTFPKVVKQTGVVLAIVIFFGLILFAFDYILKIAFKALNNVEVSVTEKWIAIGATAAIVVAVVVSLIIWLVKRKRKGN